MLIPITTFEEIIAFQEQQTSSKNRRGIFKHSDTCPVSFKAYDEVNAVLENHPDFPVFVLEVKSQRSLSDKIESFFETRHESPQLLLCKWKILKEIKNHFTVTKEWILHCIQWGYANSTE